MRLKVLEIFMSFIFFARANSDDPYDGTLKLVQVIFRHGDRNPIDTFPTYPYKDESNWPEGYAQLTKKGKNQHYTLGGYLRSRYSGFLNESYSPYEIYVKSSTVDRTLMSAEANLAGLYPPNDDISRWNPTIQWQPIPVHAEPAEGDKLLRMNAECPKYKKLKEHMLKHSEEAKQLRKRYGSVFELLNNKTGKKVETAEDVDYIYDALFIANVHYNYWPEWAPANSSNLQALREITKFSFQALAYTEEMQRLRGGPLVQELLKNFNEKVPQKLDKRRKFLMYSGHDTTLAVLLNTLGVFDPQLPPYASMVILELWEQDNELNTTYNVKVMYKNETDREPYLLSVPGCPNPCEISNLNKALKNKLPVDWDSECKDFSFMNYFGNGVIVFASISVLIFMLVAVSVVVTLIKTRHRFAEPPKYPYLHLQQEDEEA